MDYRIKLPSDFDPVERGQRASELFMQGYNCCQAVLLAFSDILEPIADRQQLATIGSGFGGGMARMREVCGSFSGMVMMAGFISPADDPSVKDARKNNYALVQQFAQSFREVVGGSIVCRELLGLSSGKAAGPVAPEGAAPTERTPEFYRKRPCPQIIANAARIVAEELQKNS